MSGGEPVGEGGGEAATPSEGVAETAPPVAPVVPVAAKVDPETLVLRGSPRRVVRFRRELIIGVAATVMLGIAATAWIALGPASFKLAASGEDMFERRDARAPEALTGTPGRYDEMPQLGPPLPGDLGRPILEHQRSLVRDGSAPGDVVGADAAAAAAAARDRLAAEEAAGRQSAVLMSLGARRAPEMAASGAGAALSAAPSLAAGAGTSEASPAAKAASEGGGHVSPERIAPAASPWLISSGSVIAASLVTGLNSDLPGLVVAHVSENAYDSITGRILLIPQGARLIGRYAHNLAYGQRRAFVAWQRIIWPDGSSLALDDAPASDPSGYAGLAGRVDTHGGQLLKGVALATLLGVGTEIGFGDAESELVRALRESAQQNGSRAGGRLVEKGLDIEPTIVVRPGAPVRVIVNKDLILKPWRP